ncbi:hypothetical protein K439DRAFT_1631333, partial [Ramaria rubella]
MVFQRYSSPRASRFILYTFAVLLALFAQLASAAPAPEPMHALTPGQVIRENRLRSCINGSCYYATV